MEPSFQFELHMYFSYRWIRGQLSKAFKSNCSRHFCSQSTSETYTICL